MSLVIIRRTDVATMDFRYVVNATDIHRAADIATAQYKLEGHDWSKSKVHEIRPLGDVYSII